MPADVRYHTKQLNRPEGTYKAKDHSPSEVVANEMATGFRKKGHKALVSKSLIDIPVNAVTFTKTGIPKYKKEYIEQTQYVVFVCEKK
jgi:hypothetical protein